MKKLCATIERVEWQLAPRSRCRCVFVRSWRVFSTTRRTHDYVRTSHCQCQPMGPIAYDRSYQLRIMNNFFWSCEGSVVFYFKKNSGFITRDNQRTLDHRFTNFSKIIAFQDEIFHEKFSTMTIFIPCKLHVKLYQVFFVIIDAAVMIVQTTFNSKVSLSIRQLYSDY